MTSPILDKFNSLASGDQFNADEAVVSLRLHAPLATLHDELQAYLTSLKSKVLIRAPCSPCILIITNLLTILLICICS